MNIIYQAKIVRWLIGGEWLCIQKEDFTFWIPACNMDHFDPYEVRCIKTENYY